MTILSEILCICLCVHLVGGWLQSPRVKIRSSACRTAIPTRLWNHVEDDEYIPPLADRKPLKVLLCVEPTPFNYVSGYANRFKEMLKFMKQAGDEVHVVTADSDPKAPRDFLGFPITSLKGSALPVYKQVRISFDLRGAIPKLIKSFKPDLLHVSAPSALIYPVTLWAKIFNIPTVMSYHTDLVGYTKTYFPLPGVGKIAEFLVKFFLNHGDLVLCTSPQLKDEMKKIGVDRVDVWRKGINTEIFSPSFRDEEMRNYLSGGHPDKPLLLCVGRLGVEKRIGRLKKVLDANPNARLAIVGKGPAGDDLQKEFANYPVVFAGQLVGEALSKAFASSDIFVMPSDTETLGFVVMEALASGTPVVGVAAGGVVDIIEDSHTGYLAENADDMEEFSQKVKVLIENPTLRSNLSSNAVHWAKKWSWEAATSKLRNVQYRKAIALHRSRDHKGRFYPEVVQAIMNASSISPII